jgi:hypothetical protein
VNVLFNLTLPQGAGSVQGRRVILIIPFRPARNIAFTVVCPYSGRRWLDRRILNYVAMGSERASLRVWRLERCATSRAQIGRFRGALLHIGRLPTGRTGLDRPSQIARKACFAGQGDQPRKLFMDKSDAKQTLELPKIGTIVLLI